jgi:hypothetical protein
MKLTVVAGTLLAGMAMTTTAFAGSQGNTCTARVLHSEELPFAPFGSWLVKVTLEVTPPDGNAYEVKVQDDMPWQGPPPRRGQKFRLLCDPANPGDLHFVR